MQQLKKTKEAWRLAILEMRESQEKKFAHRGCAAFLDKLVVKNSINMREAANIVSKRAYVEMKAGVVAQQVAEQEWQRKFDSGDYNTMKFEGEDCVVLPLPPQIRSTRGMGWHRQMQQAPVSLGSKQDEDTHYNKMVKLGQVDLAADNAWAPFGGRLLKPPNALPPPPSTSTSCPLSKRSRDELCDSQEDPAGVRLLRRQAARVEALAVPAALAV